MRGIFFVILCFSLMINSVGLKAEEFDIGKYIEESFLQTKLKSLGLRWVNNADDVDKTHFRHFGLYKLNDDLNFMYGYRSDSFKKDFLGAEKVMIQFQYNFEKMEMK